MGRQADTDEQRDAGPGVHQPQVRGQPGGQAAAEVPVAAESPAGVRSDAGRPQDGVSRELFCRWAFAGGRSADLKI